MTATDWTKVNEEYAKNCFMGETGKAHERRLIENWFDRYCPADRSGIDIGSGQDRVNKTFRPWDFEFGDPDATYLEGVESDSCWTVYASHILEHLPHPAKALARWYDVVTPGGHLIVLVPHRDMYEKKRFLPSQWNPDHRYFWHPEDEDPPCTKCLRTEMLRAVPSADIVSYKILDSGYDWALAKNEHPIGEYSIEMIVRKPCS